MHLRLSALAILPSFYGFSSQGTITAKPPSTDNISADIHQRVCLCSWTLWFRLKSSLAPYYARAEGNSQTGYCCWSGPTRMRNSVVPYLRRQIWYCLPGFWPSDKTVYGTFPLHLSKIGVSCLLLRWWFPRFCAWWYRTEDGPPPRLGAFWR